ncbi:J domain-containing protein [Paenibacillus psychroresistens]|uniref:J domain-containing protein n=1 Tax=Paenibacillus psychroresistens TaxID=1778678 RepID=A0A6B8RK84_9BACL|nr:J domain-containing protein [Paenibacillus psychroresistens]QGQ96164.1 J domain-containing protein [Paenibacillus psychroresistens]
MQDRLEAFKILGLPEEAQRQEIESRYFHLVKKYKYLAQDEQPSLGEPIFAVINEAYHLLIGYSPMQKIQFKQLDWKEKLQHIREYYMMQISLSVIFVLAVVGMGFVIHDINKSLQDQPTSSSITSIQASPLPNLDCNAPQRALR